MIENCLNNTIVKMWQVPNSDVILLCMVYVCSITRSGRALTSGLCLAELHRFTGLGLYPKIVYQLRLSYTVLIRSLIMQYLLVYHHIGGQYPIKTGKKG